MSEVLELMTLEKVAEAVKLKPQSIRNAVITGKLRAYKLGNRWRFDPADVRAWLDSQKTDKEVAA